MPEGVTYALRVAGEPHVWPRAILLRGLRGSPGAGGARCPGEVQSMVCQRPPRGGGNLAGDLVPKDRRPRERRGGRGRAQANLEPLPRRVRASSWVEMRARVLVRASGAKVIALGPSGPPRTVPTSSLVEGQVRARINLNRPGTWTLQLVLNGGMWGPRAGPRGAGVERGSPPPMPPASCGPRVRKTAGRTTRARANPNGDAGPRVAGPLGTAARRTPRQSGARALRTHS